MCYQKRDLRHGHATGSCVRVRHQTAPVQTRLLSFADSVTLGNALDLFNFQFSYLKNGESDICLKGCGEVEKLDDIYEVLWHNVCHSINTVNKFIYFVPKS